MPSSSHATLRLRTRRANGTPAKGRFAALEAYVKDALERMTLAELSTVRDFRYRDRQGGTAGWALLHALEHVGIHLGHAQITRQLWQQENPS